MASPLASAVRSAAPGKVILLGEHAVVYGRTALAATIDRYVEVAITPGGDQVCPTPHVREALLRAAQVTGIDASNLTVRLSADLPASVGLGSSAALSVALVRALAKIAGQSPADAVVCARAFEIEKIFHGFPSGIDNTVVTYGGLIAFRRDVGIKPLVAPRSLPLVIALGDAPRETQKAVRGLREKWTASPGAYEPLFDEIDAIANQAERAIAGADLTLLGALLSTNHGLLQRLEVSTPELDAMVKLACGAGALGAKLTGGGGGGAVICLCDGDRQLLVERFARAGWHAFSADIAPRRVDGVHDASHFERRPCA